MSNIGWLHLTHGGSGNLKDAAARGEARAVGSFWENPADLGEAGPSGNLKDAAAREASAGARRGDWRGLLARLATTAGNLRADGRPSLTGTTLAVQPDPWVGPYATPEHERAAAALLRTPAIVVGGNYASGAVLTVDGGAPRAPDDGGAADLAGFTFAEVFSVAAVVAVSGPFGLVSYGLGSMLGEAAKLEDLTALREADTDSMVRLTAIVEQVMRNHAEAEAAAGHTLPFTEGEKKLIAQLEAMQATVADRLAKPQLKPEPSNLWAFLGRVASAAVTGAEIAGGLFVAGSIVWLIFKWKGLK